MEVVPSEEDRALSEPPGEAERQRAERFTALAHEVAEPLRRYAVRRTDPHTAEDVVADALLVVWRRLDEVPEEHPLPWCYGVVRGCLANAERSARRRGRLLGRLAAAGPPASTEPDLDDGALSEALAGLNRSDRELVRLWAWEDLRPQEIAVVLGVTPNAVSIRLHRVRRRLAAALAAAERTGDRKETAG